MTALTCHYLITRAVSRHYETTMYLPFDHLNPATNGATRLIASKPASRTHLDMDCSRISTIRLYISQQSLSMLYSYKGIEELRVRINQPNNKQVYNDEYPSMHPLPDAV